MSFQNSEVNSLLYELKQCCLLKERFKSRFLINTNGKEETKWEKNELEIIRLKTNWEIGKLDKYTKEVLNEKINIGVIGWVEVIKKEYDERDSNSISNHD